MTAPSTVALTQASRLSPLSTQARDQLPESYRILTTGLYGEVIVPKYGEVIVQSTGK